NTAHTTLHIVFQFEMPNINIALLASDVELWLIAEYPMEFTIDEINIVLKEAVGSRCKTPLLNSIILKAGPAPNSNLAIHRTCEIYIEDLNLNQEDSLDIAYNEDIFCRLTDYSNNRLKLNSILD
ncbi:11750_t:CDS:2, partial [Dentiscutata heterogama]